MRMHLRHLFPSAALLFLWVLHAPPAFAQGENAPLTVEEEDLPDAALRPMSSSDWHAARFTELQAELAARRSSPRALATLVRLAGLVDELDSLAPMALLLSRFAEERDAHGEARSFARHLHALVEVKRGRLPRARSQLDALNFATDGWIVGGFDNEGGTGHTTENGPETGALDLAATYEGKERPIRWQRTPPAGWSGRIELGEALRPRKNATMYYLVTLDAPAAGRAVLFVGTSGATKMWVNGGLVLDDPADHPARFDQNGVAFAARKGPNPVLVKVSTLDQYPALYLRAAQPNGRPLGGAKWSVPSPGAALPDLAGPPLNGNEKVAAYDDLADQLAKLVNVSPNDGALREDYATVLLGRRAFDAKTQKGRRELQKACEALSGSARCWQLLAANIDDDPNARLLAHERAVAADPAWAPSRVALAEHALERGFNRRALDAALSTVDAAPGHAPARLLLARAWDAVGTDGRGTRTTLDAAQLFATSPTAVLAAARAERSLGRRTEAMARLRVLLSLRYDHTTARIELASLLLDAGRVADAASLLRRGLELRPADVSLHLRLGNMLSLNGDAPGAMSAFEQAARIAPDDDEVAEAWGQHLLREGRTDDAVAKFQRALDLKPQNTRLRELVRSLKPQEQYAAPFLRDAHALAAAALLEPAPPGEDVVVLADVNVVRTYSNGLASRTRQVVFRVLTRRGVESERVQAIAFTPGDQEVRIERARLFKPDGSIVENKGESERNIGASGGMFFDRRQRIVSFSRLEPGDVVEFTQRTDDVAGSNMFGDYFGDVEFLQGSEIRRDTEYVLVAPPDRHFFANEPALPGVIHSVTAEADRKVWRWRVKDVPKVEPEPRAPGWADLAAYLHVSTFKDWDSVARYWWGLVKEQLHAGPDVVAAAEEAVKGIPAADVKGRVRAVYGYVVRKTRYIGLEFGIHGFKPYKVDQVLSRRFGDCKDKASLMFAMLKHLGIRSDLVLLRMRHLGRLAPSPASLAVFNHAILYVPSLDLYLDGTAEHSGAWELPFADQGAQVLVVRDESREKSDLALTPVLPAASNVTKARHRIVLAADGSARVEATSTTAGVSAAGWRSNYESETGRREKFERGYTRTYPGSTVASVTFNDLRDIESPVTATFTLDVPRLATADGDALTLQPMGEPFRYTEALAPLSRRRFPVDLTPTRNEFEYAVELPPGLSLAQPVAPVALDTPFGQVRLAVTPSADGRSVRVEGALALSADRIAPSDYDAFRTFLQDLDRTFSLRIRLAPAAGTVAP